MSNAQHIQSATTPSGLKRVVAALDNAAPATPRRADSLAGALYL